MKRALLVVLLLMSVVAWADDAGQPTEQQGESDWFFNLFICQKTQVIDILSGTPKVIPTGIGAIIYKSSIIQQRPGVYRFWTLRLDTKNDPIPFGNGGYQKYFIEINYNDNTIRYIAVVYYNCDSHIIKNIEFSQNVSTSDYIVPGSVGDGLALDLKNYIDEQNQTKLNNKKSRK